MTLGAEGEDFARRLEAVRQRVETIRDQEEIRAPQQAFDDLLSAMEELRVAQEEMSQQNERLAESHHAVTEERRRYQQLFHFAPDAYLLTDLHGIVREANRSAARLLSVEPRFMAGKAFVSFVAPDDRARVRARVGTLAIRAHPQDARDPASAARWRRVRRGHRPVRGPGRPARHRHRVPLAGA